MTAPKHLQPATKRWFRAVIAEWDLDAHHVRLLQLACEAWDRAQQAREQIARDGLTVATGGGGLKRHPCCAIESESRIAFARLLRELDLDLEPPKDASRRPPALMSIRGGSGNAA